MRAAPATRAETTPERAHTCPCPDQTFSTGIHNSPETSSSSRSS